jgi:sec-independent protein translocase protein TatC
MTASGDDKGDSRAGERGTGRGKREDNANDIEERETDGKKMSFLEHLEELRKSLLRMLIVVALGTAVCFYFSRDLLAFIIQPAGITLIYITPFEAFFAQFRIALALGLYVTLPLSAFFIWQFIAPAIHRRRKILVIPFMVFVFIFFTVGAYFAYLILPVTMQFFRSFEMEGSLKASWSVGRYVDFVLRMLVGFGAVFEAPVVVFFLARMSLLSAKTMLFKWKWFVLGIFILAAVITPGQDIFSMLLLASPLLVLYLISIIVALLAFPKRKAEAEVG